MALQAMRRVRPGRAWRRPRIAPFETTLTGIGAVVILRIAGCRGNAAGRIVSYPRRLDCRRSRKRHHMRRSHLTAAMVAIALAAFGIASDRRVAAQQRAEAHDMQLVGFHDLQARSAYQPVIHRQGDRFIAYVGHHGGTQLNPLTGKQESNGTSILDVTDPRRPKYLAHVPGEP